MGCRVEISVSGQARRYKRSAHAPRLSTRRPDSGKAKVMTATVAGRFLWKVYNPGLPAKLSSPLLLTSTHPMFSFMNPQDTAPLELFFLFFLLVILLLLLGSWACAMALEEAGEEGLVILKH